MIDERLKRIDICDKDCEVKKIYENPTKYYDFIIPSLLMCNNCIYNKKIDHFIQREEKKKEDVMECK